VFIEGRLTFDTWTAQDGTKRSRHRVTVENFQFLPGGGTQAAGTDQAVQSTHADSEAEQKVEDDIPF
jgi:single-strand DNA-binding protein